MSLWSVYKLLLYRKSHTALHNASFFPLTSWFLHVSRAVEITTISQYCAIDEHNRWGMQQPQQPWYFRVFFFLRLCPSRSTHRACLLNISNDNNVYHADLYRGSINLHLTTLNIKWERNRLITCDYRHLSFSPSHAYLWKQVVMSKESEIFLNIDTLLVSWAFKNGTQC